MLCAILAAWVCKVEPTSGTPADAMPAFETEVVGARAFAHAGPGIEFYPTQLLPRGEKVVVYAVRNGWAAVAPPRGSFSWVPLDAVLEEEDGTGRITADNVRLRVGSALSDAHHVFQTTLNKGEKVQILDRMPLRDAGKVGEWFKVRPHKDELRYIAAENLKLPERSAAAPVALPPGPAPPTDPRTNSQASPTSIPPAGALNSRPVETPLQPVSTTGAAPIRPASGRIIPSATPLDRLEPGRSEASTEEKGDRPPLTLSDDPTQPIARRIQSARSQLEIISKREPSRWNLDNADQIVEGLRTAAQSETDKAAVSELRALVRRLTETQERYRRTIGRFDSALQRDKELANQQLSLQLGLEKMTRKYAAEGTVRRATINVGDQPTLAVENDKKQVTHYAVSPAGLNLEKYLGKRVGLLGPVVRRPNVPVPVVEVEQVMPLE